MSKAQNWKGQQRNAIGSREPGTEGPKISNCKQPLAWVCSGKREMRAKGQKAHGKKESEVQDCTTRVKKQEQITVTMETLKWRLEAVLDLFHPPPKFLSVPYLASRALKWLGT